MDKAIEFTDVWIVESITCTYLSPLFLFCCERYLLDIDLVFFSQRDAVNVQVLWEVDAIIVSVLLGYIWVDLVLPLVLNSTSWRWLCRKCGLCYWLLWHILCRGIWLGRLRPIFFIFYANLSTTRQNVIGFVLCLKRPVFFPVGVYPPVSA